MQHEHEHANSGALRKFLREKGYYIVLFLCIAAVGISGYVFLSGAVHEREALNEASLSVATPATVPQTQKTTGASTGSAAQSAAASAPEESTQTAAAATIDRDEQVRQAAASVRVWPVSGTSIAAYSMEQLSYNVTTRDWRTHDGVDLAAAAGEPVKAACAGTVTAVYDDEYLGTTVVVSHADGYSTQYSNLAAMPSVRAGDSVSAGDVIGAVGATALLEVGAQPHLHFAVFSGGASVDPTDYIG